MLHKARGRGVECLEEKHYEGGQFNIITIMRGGVKFPGKSIM